MKNTKKLLSLLLAAVMMLSCFAGMAFTTSAEITYPEAAVEVAADTVTYLNAAECGLGFDSSGNALSVTTRAGQDMFEFVTGSYVTYKINVAESGTYDVAFNVASNWGCYRYDVYVDGTLAVEEWTGNSNRKTQNNPYWSPAKEIELTKGTHTLKVVSRDGMALISCVRIGPKGSFPDYANGYSTLYDNTSMNTNGTHDDGYYGYRTWINAEFDAVSLHLWNGGDGNGAIWNVGMYKWAGSLKDTLATEAIIEKEFRAYWDRFADLEFDDPQEAGEYLFYITSKSASGIWVGVAGHSGVPSSGSYGYNYINSEEATQTHIPRIFVFTTEAYEGDLFGEKVEPEDTEKPEEPEIPENPNPSNGNIPADKVTYLGVSECGKAFDKDGNEQVVQTKGGLDVFSFGTGCYITYDINVEKSGKYDIAVFASSYWAKDYFDVIVDGKTILQVKDETRTHLKKTNNNPYWSPAYEIELTEGSHTLKVLSTNAMAFISGLRIGPVGSFVGYEYGYSTLTNLPKDESTTYSVTGNKSFGYRTWINAEFEAFSIRVNENGKNDELYNISMYKWKDNLKDTLASEPVITKKFTTHWDTFIDFELDTPQPAGDYLFYMTAESGYVGVMYTPIEKAPADGTYGYNYFDGGEAVQTHIPRIIVYTTEPYEGDLFSDFKGTKVNVAADGTTVIDLIEHGTWTENNLEPENKKADITVMDRPDEGKMVGDFRYGDVASFKFKITTSGSYKLSLTHVWELSTEWELSINGEKMPVTITATPNWDTVIDANLGEFRFEEGEYVIKLTCVQKDGGNHIAALNVTFLEEEPEWGFDYTVYPDKAVDVNADKLTAINAAANALWYDNSADAYLGISDYNGVDVLTNFRPGDILAYKINVQKAGNYDFAVNFIWQRPVEILVSVDGGKPFSMTLKGFADWNTLTVSNPVQMELTEGEHTLKIIFSEVEGVHIESVHLAPEGTIENTEGFVFSAAYDCDESAHVIKDSYAYRTTVNAAFNKISVWMPTWGNTDASCTVALYAWAGNYEATVASDAIVTKSLQPMGGDAWRTLEFDAQPAGEYLVYVYDCDGDVGLYIVNDDIIVREGYTVKGIAYVEGNAPTQDHVPHIKVTTVERYDGEDMFGECSEDVYPPEGETTVPDTEDTTAPETTAPDTTVAPETTDAPVADTTAAPAEETTAADTKAPAATTAAETSGGCGSVVASASAIALIAVASAAAVVLKKRED